MRSSSSILLFAALFTTSLFMDDACPNNCHCYASTGFRNICNCSSASLHNVPDKDVDRNTTELLATDNFITILNISTFDAFHNRLLEVISVANNSIREIESSALRKLYYLRQLNISYNCITHLPSYAFFDNVYLKEIAIAHNNITVLHSKLFSKNRRLRVIDLSFNRIKLIPSDLFNYNVDVTHIYLNNNALTSIDKDGFKHNKNLKYVNLSNNLIASIDNILLLYNKSASYKFSSNNILILSWRTFKNNNCISCNNDLCLTENLKLIDCLKMEMVIDISKNPTGCDSKALQLYYKPRKNNLNINSNKLIHLRRRREKRSLQDRSVVHNSKESEKTNNATVNKSGNNSIHQQYKTPRNRASVNVTLLQCCENSTNIAIRDIQSTNLYDAKYIYTNSYNKLTVHKRSSLNVNSNSTNTIETNTSSVIYDNYSSSENETFTTYDLNLTLTTLSPADIRLISFEFDSPLVARESTVRGIFFILLECLFACMIVLKKLIFASKPGSHLPDMIELIPRSEPKTEEEVEEEIVVRTTTV